VAGSEVSYQGWLYVKTKGMIGILVKTYNKDMVGVFVPN